MTSPATMYQPRTTPFRVLNALLFALALVLATGCIKKDQVAADLLSLNAAGRAATQQADLQQAMARARSVNTPADKAAILRDTGGKLVKVQGDLEKIDIRSPEVKALQGRLAAMFGQVGNASKAAAKALEDSDSVALDRASKTMQESQREINTVAQELARLAKEHKVDLNKL